VDSKVEYCSTSVGRLRQPAGRGRPQGRPWGRAEKVV